MPYCDSSQLLPSCRSKTTLHSQTPRASLTEFIFAAGAEKDAPPPLRQLCGWRTFVVATLFTTFVSACPLLVYAEEVAEAGVESFIPCCVAQTYSSRELSSEAILAHDVSTPQRSSGERIFKFPDRKLVLRRGATDDSDDSAKELYPEALLDISSKGIFQLSSGNDEFPESDANPNRRMLIPDTKSVCTNKDISISQGPDGSSGIPRYFVQIVNTCMSDCAPSQVHVSCGWFASAVLVNPNTFRRLTYNDCLVNGGKPLKYGEIVRFSYANSFMYPIRFKSASFCR